MGKKNEAQLVKIEANVINLRATSLRARLTDAVAMYKCGNSKELRDALVLFDKAVTEFKKAII